MANSIVRLTAFTGKVVLITGASSGIGMAMARDFSRLGAHVVLCARRIDRLSQLAEELSNSGAESIAVQADVTKDGDLEAAVEKALSKWGHLDVLIANAGFGVAGRFDKLTLEDYRRQFETNVFGVIRSIYAALDALKKSGGRIAITGSVAGFLPIPGNSPYAMSKAALVGLDKALGAELKSHGVSVTLILPGFVDSEIFQVDNQGKLHDTAGQKPPKWLLMKAPKAAREIIEGIERRKSRVVITGHGKLTLALNRFAPGLIAAGIKRFWS
jgi:short-subunit dehydrogenase